MIQPLFLFADSQLLFWRDGSTLFLHRAREGLDSTLPARPLRAAYLGASNGDVTDYFDLFTAAMEGIDVRACRMIPTLPSPRDLAFLDEADLIMLAGGDVARGFRAFQAADLLDRILARYASGAVLMGVSAGAMQLGLRAFDHTDETFEALRLAPCIVGVHDEPAFSRLARVVAAREGRETGIGIPSGGGAIVHPDLTIEPVRKPLVEITCVEGRTVSSLILPPAPASTRQGA